MKIGSALACLVALMVAAPGCGGAAEEETTVTPTERSSGDERREEPNDGAEITGLMGTISQDAVRDALEPRMSYFARCFARADAVEFISGDVRLSFRIHTDGTVAWVFPMQTSVGDLATEECILDVARRARFSRPHGGEAEFTWGFSLDVADDVRPPVTWQASSVDALVSANGTALRGQCGRGGFRITAYVAPGGRVLSAGGSAPDADSLQALSCVVAGVRAWQMPDPGSYAAKVTFDI